MRWYSTFCRHAIKLPYSLENYLKKNEPRLLRKSVKKMGWDKIIFLVINIMSQMLSTDLDLYLTWNIPLSIKYFCGDKDALHEV